MLNNTLFDDNLPTILNIQSLVRFAVQHTSLHVEVAAGAVGLDSHYNGLDASRSRCGNIGIVEYVKRIGHARIVHVSYTCIAEQGVETLAILNGWSTTGSILSSIGKVVASEGVELGVRIVLRRKACPCAVVDSREHAVVIHVHLLVLEVCYHLSILGIKCRVITQRGTLHRFQEADKVVDSYRTACELQLVNARMLGFSEPTSFYRYFKRVTGMTAKEYRDRNLLL